MTKGYIFDLDGTLLNTLPSLANCFNRSLEHFGYPIHPTEHYRYFIGDGLRRAVERCLPADRQSEEHIREFTQIQQVDYGANWMRDVTIYDGIEELLSQLQSTRSDIKTAVFSNKDHRFTTQCVNHFFPHLKFDLVQGHTMQVPHKPDPTGAIMIARELGTEASEFAFIGDTWADIETAVRSGMMPVGALWGFREKEELKNAGAKHIIKHPLEVLEITRD